MYRTRFVDRSSVSTNTMFGRVAIVPIGTVGVVDAELLEPNVEQPASNVAATTPQAARATRDRRDHPLDVSGSASLTTLRNLVYSPRATKNANRPENRIGRAPSRGLGRPKSVIGLDRSVTRS